MHLLTINAVSWNSWWVYRKVVIRSNVLVDEERSNYVVQHIENLRKYANLFARMDTWDVVLVEAAETISFILNKFIPVGKPKREILSGHERWRLISNWDIEIQANISQ